MAAKQVPDELVMDDGQFALRDIDEFYAKTGALGFSTFGGSPVAYIPGKGAVLMHDLVKGMKPDRKLKSIEGDKS
jgi:hypothetical protein